MTTSTLHAGQRPAEGLYDPRARASTPAASASSWTSRAESRTRIVGQGHPGPGQPPAPRGVRLRGRTPATAPASLIQMPDRFLRRECARIGVAPAARRPSTAPAWCSCRVTMQADKVRALLHSIVEDEGLQLLGWRDVPTDDSSLGATARSVEPTIRQVFVGRRRAGHSTQPRAQSSTWSASSSKRPWPRSTSREQVRLRPEPVLQHAHLQGHAQRRPDRRRCSPTSRTRGGVGAGARALSGSAPTRSRRGRCAPVPVRGAQRRDQHAARQHQLDAGARGAAVARTRWATTCARCCRSPARGLATTATFDNVLEFLVMNGRSLPHAILMMIPSRGRTTSR